ncbi:MAG TPA: chemotaxis protein CheW, partial [Candidatus Polarisedimenticolia bacterium]|nr:chemotaxis protein CheW [Candidatus Polarisedimenticolia bacterium]
SQVFARLTSMVERAARAAGREVDLHTFGGDTELDKAMVDELASPLVHLLANAVDHGIEPPDERQASGKPRRGRLVLSAFQKGPSVVIDVIDDGRGVALDLVRRAAETRGLLAAGQPFTARQACELIFAPGFSTAARVSQVSGRGVGLDVVRRSIRRIKGGIETRSVEGKGTTFTVTVPITLALVQALIVLSGQRRFAIPVASIRENLRLDQKRMRRVGAGEVYDHPHGPLPLVRLSALVSGSVSTAGAGERYAVVAGAPGRCVGLVIDAFLGQQDIMIKPVGRRLRDLPGLAGATDLGDATAVLVLDPEALVSGGASGRAVA